MRLLTRSLALTRAVWHEIFAFISWWVFELWEVAEVVLARLAPGLAKPILLRVKEGELLLDDAPFEKLEHSRKARTILALDSEAVLTHDVTFPAAVEQSLEQVVALHLERELPLSRDRLCVEWSVVRRYENAGRIVVRLLAAHREQVERARALAMEKGLRPVRIGMFQPDGTLSGNLLSARPAGDLFRLTLRDSRVGIAAVALALGAIGVIGAQWIYERHHVGRELERVRALAAESETLERRIQSESEGVARLARLTREPDAVDVLAQLTTSVPQDSWTYDLEVSPAKGGGYQIRMAGFVPTATMFVDLLEKEPHLEQVRLVSASSAGLGSGKDHLRVTARWVVE